MATKIRVIIADDHAILRNGLRWMIGSQEDMEVVGEAGDFASAVFLSGSLEADVMTLDLTMPAGSVAAPVVASVEAVAAKPDGVVDPLVHPTTAVSGAVGSPDLGGPVEAAQSAAAIAAGSLDLSAGKPSAGGARASGSGRIGSVGTGSSGGGSGVGAIARILALKPGLRIIVLTMHDDPAYCRSMLAAGASGYLVKSAADSELITAIRTVHSGGQFVDMQTSSAASEGAAATVVDRFVITGKAVEGGKVSTLSAREREVLVMVAQGHTNQAIADRLGLSVKTVESYRARLMEKLGLANRAELTQFALDLGLVGEGTTKA